MVLVNNVVEKDMKISLQADLGFRLLLFLSHLPQGSHKSVRVASGLLSVSYEHLNKVSKILVQNGYLRSVRGSQGGVALNMAPESVRLLDVFCLLEPDLQLIDCAGGKRGPCVFLPSCKLKTLFSDATEAFLDTLAPYSLADIMPSSDVFGVIDGDRGG